MQLEWEPIPGDNTRQAFHARTPDGSFVDAVVMRRQRNPGVWKFMVRYHGDVVAKFIHGKENALFVAEYLVEEFGKGPDSYLRAIETAKTAIDNDTVRAGLLAATTGFSRS